MVDAKFKMKPDDISTAILNTLVEVLSHIGVLAEITIANECSRTKRPFSEINEAYQASYLNKRKEVLDKIFAQYGTVEIDDIS